MLLFVSSCHCFSFHGLFCTDSELSRSRLTELGCPVGEKNVKSNRAVSISTTWRVQIKRDTNKSWCVASFKMWQRAVAVNVGASWFLNNQHNLFNGFFVTSKHDVSEHPSIYHRNGTFICLFRAASVITLALVNIIGFGMSDYFGWSLCRIYLRWWGLAGGPPQQVQQDNRPDVYIYGIHVSVLVLRPWIAYK